MVSAACSDQAMLPSSIEKQVYYSAACPYTIVRCWFVQGIAAVAVAAACWQCTWASAAARDAVLSTTYTHKA
jgi:hypothetical protein